MFEVKLICKDCKASPQVLAHNCSSFHCVKGVFDTRCPLCKGRNFTMTVEDYPIMAIPQQSRKFVDYMENNKQSEGRQQ
jgi:hypothetical protein